MALSAASLQNHVGSVLTWVTLVRELRGYVGYVSRIFTWLTWVAWQHIYMEDVGWNFYVSCVGQIHFCVIQCFCVVESLFQRLKIYSVGQIFLRSSILFCVSPKNFVWINFICMGQLLLRLYFVYSRFSLSLYFFLDLLRLPSNSTKSIFNPVFKKHFLRYSALANKFSLIIKSFICFFFSTSVTHKAWLFTEIGKEYLPKRFGYNKISFNVVKKVFGKLHGTLKLFRSFLVT